MLDRFVIFCAELLLTGSGSVFAYCISCVIIGPIPLPLLTSALIVVSLVLHKVMKAE